MKKLTEEDVLRIIREEWDRKVATLNEELKATLKTVSGEVKPTVSAGLKIKHKKSGTLYTVDSVGQGSVVVREPEGRQSMVTSAVLEKEFELE